MAQLSIHGVTKVNIVRRRFPQEGVNGPAFDVIEVHLEQGDVRAMALKLFTEPGGLPELTGDESPQLEFPAPCGTGESPSFDGDDCTRCGHDRSDHPPGRGGDTYEVPVDVKVRISVDHEEA